MEFGLFLIIAVFVLGVVAGVPVAFTLGIAALAGFLWEGTVSYTHLTLPTNREV